MTTAHRATFTHAKAKNTSLTQSYQSTLSHKRALPAHTQLKYRIKKKTRDELEHSKQGNNTTSATAIHGKAMDVYLDDMLQNENADSQRTYDTGSDDDSDGDDTEPIIISGSSKSQVLNFSKKPFGKTEEEAEKETTEEEDEDEDGDDDDSEDDTEQLLLELQKITKEKERKRKEREELEAEQAAANSNPLMKMEDKEEHESKRSTWRSNTLFRKQKKAEKDEDSLIFTNDTVHSEFHRRFINKYIR